MLTTCSFEFLLTYNKQDLQQFLNNQQEKLTNECIFWNEKFSTDTEALKNNLQELTEERDHNLVRLEALQTRWDNDEACAKAKVDEARRCAELEQLRIEEDARQNNAACVIQGQFKRNQATSEKKKPAKKEKAKKAGKGKKKK